MRRLTCLGMALLFGLLFARTGFAAAPTYDATGEWDITPYNFSDNCEEHQTRDPYTVVLIQQGTAIIVVHLDEEHTLKGTVSGVTYTIKDTWYDWYNDGQITENYTITASSESQATGTDKWSFSTSGYSCSGQHQLTLARSPQNTATYDATGTWQYTISDFVHWCDQADAPPASGTLTITQTGTKATLTTVINGQQVEYRGFLSGSTYTLVRSYPDDGGTVSHVFTIELENGGRTGSGPCDWVWNDKNESCGGWFDIFMTRAPLAITAGAGSGGSLSPSGSVSVAYGESQTFTMTPNAGYRVQDVRVDGVSVGAKRSYTFSNVQAAHTIEALFEEGGAAMPWLQLLLGG